MGAHLHQDYKKLVKTGGTRTLAVGTLLPTAWHLVRVTKGRERLGKPKEWVYIKIERVV
ncbi:hypothetical protein ES703_25841 [subsurface metagenome]